MKALHLNLIIDEAIFALRLAVLFGRCWRVREEVAARLDNESHRGTTSGFPCA
jgi:hypothetical protein